MWIFLKGCNCKRLPKNTVCCEDYLKMCVYVHTHINSEDNKVLSKFLSTEDTLSKMLLCGGNVNWYSHYGEQYGGSLKTLKTELPYDPANPLLGIY